ncbi:ArsR/SmtB family transcription factor [Actinocatenispora rupis]|nr:helix-turn-helix transcriptional regulator [Actinocatenispora rupis]
MELYEPDMAAVPVTTVLSALGDDARLAIVRELHRDGERCCGTFDLGLAKATRSHHLKVLREAGITHTRIEGTSRFVSLRRDEIERRYPGLLDAVLGVKQGTAH